MATWRRFWWTRMTSCQCAGELTTSVSSCWVNRHWPARWSESIRCCTLWSAVFVTGSTACLSTTLVSQLLQLLLTYNEAPLRLLLLLQCIRYELVLHNTGFSVSPLLVMVLRSWILPVFYASLSVFLQRVDIACYADGCISQGRVCSSVCPSVTRWYIVSRRMKLRSCGFHHQVGQSSYFLERYKYRLEIRRGSPLARELKWGRRLSQAKIWPIMSHNLETVQDRIYVTINH